MFVPVFRYETIKAEMLLSKSCVYGIQAAIYVAAQPTTDYIPIGRIAEHLGVSFHFLTKVLQHFSETGILLSYRGPKGGVALARPSAHITVYDMVCAIDGDYLFKTCILGLPGCGIAEPCPAHEEWSETRMRCEEIARDTTLALLTSEASALNARLKAGEEAKSIRVFLPKKQTIDSDN